ncbi:LuxR C-terminal-related transcriptional regulator [Xanthobacter sediminis]|uniref:LuxR C-terminal-related transcriptional regulator n=1 Tax=Xanthobacter sediminis TaxID=3119926 RepID=UPI00372ADD88
MTRPIEDVISDIEAAASVDELKIILQSVVEDCGFSAFSFVDALRAGDLNPTVVNSIARAFDGDYRAEGLLAVDPVIPLVRRTNTPFTWGAVPLPPRLGRRIPGARKTFEIARDHGYTDGLVIPFHYVDKVGRPYSSVCTLFWSEKPSDFRRSIEENRAYLHMILIYWAQRAVELSDLAKGAADRLRTSARSEVQTLTDREREVLSWAAMGKTVQDTADIIAISADTVETHIRSCMRKLGANNKTHAVARAIFLRLIDY